MIKQCGVIGCKILGEFGPVLSISLEKVNGARCEAQLHAFAIFVVLPSNAHMQHIFLQVTIIFMDDMLTNLTYEKV